MKSLNVPLFLRTWFADEEVKALKKQTTRYSSGMDFSRLPEGIFENILARIDDVPELVGLRAVNKLFRLVLLSPKFAEAYNGRDHPASSWLMTQVFDENNIDCGILLGIEQTDAEERRTFQISLEEFKVGENVRSILLLAASGSLVLFRCVVAEDGSSTFMVLNLYSMEVVDIGGFIDSIFNDDLGKWEHFTFRVGPNIDSMRFEVTNVVIPHHDLVPRFCHCQFDFNDPAFNAWHINAAMPLNGEDGEELREFDNYFSMILVFEDGVVYKVSCQWGGVFFTQVNVLDMVLPAFLDAQREHFVQPVEGWNSIPDSHFGKDGYALLFQRETNPLVGELLSRLKVICLFKLTPNWNSYEHIATVPVDMIPPNLRNYTRGVYIEQTNNIVNVTFLGRESDGNFMLQYWYNLTTKEWGSRFTPLHDYDIAYRVVVTPSLTVGLF